MTASFWSLFLLLLALFTTSTCAKIVTQQGGASVKKERQKNGIQDKPHKVIAKTSTTVGNGKSQERAMGQDGTCAEEETENKTYGVEQEAYDKKTRALIANTTRYMEEVVHVDPKYARVRDTCRNKNARCSYWATIGECEKNSDYMLRDCAAACHACLELDYETRCAFDPDSMPNAFGPGDINAMFERITTSDEFQQYKPTIHSMPNPTDENILDGPWVVTLDDFLSEQECYHIIELGEQKGFERSTISGQFHADGSHNRHVSKDRTSANTWCKTTSDCYANTTVQEVTARIETLTGVPQTNFEELQLLKYNEGEYYREHHDLIAAHGKRQFGHRMLTMFLYLNDVQQGGSTEFPDLMGLQVIPKAGRALIWPSVLDENPDKADPRMDHAALAVEKGLKYGANAWIHQRDYKGPLSRRCD